MLSSLLVPVVYLALQFFVFHLIVRASSKRVKTCLAPFLLAFTALSFTTSKAFFLIPALASLWAQSLALNVVHIISLVFIEEHASLELDLASWRAVWTTYKLWSNPRLLKEPNHKLDDGKRQSVIVFVLLRLAKLPLYYYLHFQIMPMIYSETIIDILPSEVKQPELFTRLHEVTAREVVLRSHAAVSWIWESLVYLDGANAILASLSVVLGGDQPEEWPSLFGSPLEACGLRNFWSRFWHQLATRPYRNYGRVLCQAIGLRPNTLASNTVIAFTIFLISGLSHAAISWHLGYKDWLDIQWFLFNFLACSFEMAFLSTVRSLAKQFGVARELQMIERSWLGYTIGYTWVFGFFFCSVPFWKWPRLYGGLLEMQRWISILSRMTVLPPTS
jgi:hypothetical protein